MIMELPGSEVLGKKIRGRRRYPEMSDQILKDESKYCEHILLHINLQLDHLWSYFDLSLDGLLDKFIGGRP